MNRSLSTDALSEPAASPEIAVVIATKDRVDLLSARALASVAAQTLRPDYLVVVDDSSSATRPANGEAVASLQLPGCSVTYVENVRTVGASGSWNTALDCLFSRVEDPQRLFVAVLDDDDAWEPAYLHECFAAACDRDLDMVASGLRRIESDGPPLLNESPESLIAADFLTGNPGIQGSNLFVRLSVLLAAGGFDEALRSTTDRDLCIRIADLGGARYGRVPTVLVNHFAQSDRARLSTRGSAAKLDGLTAFWRKYVGRMTVDQRRAFSDRAATLFDWRPPSEPAPPHARGGNRAPRTVLVLGIVAHNEYPGGLFAIVHALADWSSKTPIGLDIVLLEHRGHLGAPVDLDAAASTLRDAGVSCFCITAENQAEGRGLPDQHLDGPAGPASTQTPHGILHAYCVRLAAARSASEVWLADGNTPSGRPNGPHLEDFLRWLGAARPDGAKPTIFQAAQPGSAARSIEPWLQRERVANAEHRVKRRFPDTRVRLLGSGSEAVVFTDDRKVYKCIDSWNTRMSRSQLDFLQEQVGRWTDAPGLYAIHEIAEDGPHAVLTYDYEASVPYQGGHQRDLVRLLNGCTAVGIVCNNIHPKNLVVTASSVKLIDYGADIRPWTPLGFEHMARRAFLACEHAGHPDLQSLMRRALTDPHLAELDGYTHFRSLLEQRGSRASNPAQDVSAPEANAPAHEPFSLYVGVITSDPATLRPLLDSIASLLSSASLSRLVAVVLDNGSPAGQLEAVVRNARRAGLEMAIVDEPQQRRDAAIGSFGNGLRTRPGGQVGIAHARTMLQKYLGSLLELDQGSFGWLLDDDMRADDRARVYLPWLPAFRDQGVDALIGAYEGSSPNPPLNGLRVHLVDLFHNLLWLQGLAPDALLPDRSAENAAMRAKFPDYYYDLSRKHTGHLEMPHWLEPVVWGETVAEAYSRLLAGAVGILSGDPLTRPIVANMPTDPLAAAKDSVNRGGCTFVLNHHVLTNTPNTIPRVEGREARRSDMIWAIVNRYYRRMNIKAVGFPIRHVARVTGAPSLNVEKVRGEIVGSTLYAGLTEFLNDRPRHRLDFSVEETEEIRGLTEQHLDRRLRSLDKSFHRIAGLCGAIRRVARPGELDDLLRSLDRWFTRASFVRIRAGVLAHSTGDADGFLASLQAVADDFASAKLQTDFIQAQLRARDTTQRVHP